MSQLNVFIQFSAALTNFNTLTIEGTGQAQRYYDLLLNIAGPPRIHALLTLFENLTHQCSSLTELEQQINGKIIKNDEMGALTLNLIQLWMTGTWYQLGKAWRNRYGKHEQDVTHVVSAQSYKSGLVWLAMNTSPSGAKQPGYGTWQYPPDITQTYHAPFSFKDES